MSFLRSFALVAFALLFVSSALAAPAKHAQPTIETAPAASSSGPTQWGLGVFSSDELTDGDSISAMIANGDNWIEPFVGINGTQGAFEFSVGGMYKITMAGSSKSGFHLAPGVALGNVATGTTAAGGTTSKFAFAFYGLVGGHYAVMDRLLFAFDAGPILSVVDGDLNFKMRPAGHLLGLSFHYLF